ncbi:MAG: 50S ribosomal protein L24 [Proteobacteria bacterium]|jgi:large subunit ribosomal protein L24|nr:50S ribosomal protein L24 [Pseudomonadota bacterium]
MNRLRKGDQVVVISGRDKGRKGAIVQVLANGKVLVEGINLAKKHQRPNPQRQVQGGILEKEMPLDPSNVAIVNATTGKAERIGFKTLADGKKVRFLKSNDEVLDA